MAQDRYAPLMREQRELKRRADALTDSIADLEERIESAIQEEKERAEKPPKPGDKPKDGGLFD